MMTLRICLAGATGWAGSALARGIAAAEDLKLVAGVSRRQAGRSLGEALGLPGLDGPLCATAAEALGRPCDVFVEYTQPGAAKANIATALQRGVHVVVGTSGLTDEDLEELGALAQAQGRGLLAVGNFSLAATVLQKCAEMAARFLPQWEVIDYAAAEKVDAPSGTARELASRLARVGTPRLEVPLEHLQGPRESRGAALNGTLVHAVRLPGYVLSVEVHFGALDERVSLRYDAGSSAEPYVAGALLAIRRVGSFAGLRRGLDSVMEF